MKKLIPAIVMLLVSAIALSTASYAWFTAGNSVTASGMQVQATAPASIKIAGKIGQNYTGYASSVVFDRTNADIAPTSSVDGISFYEPTSSGAEGAIEYGSAISKDANNVNHVTYEMKIKNESAVAVKVALAEVEDILATNAFTNTIRVAIVIPTQTTKYVSGQNEDTNEDIWEENSITAVSYVFGLNDYEPEYVMVPGFANGNPTYKTEDGAQKAQGPLKGEASAITGAEGLSTWQGVAVGDDTFKLTQATAAIFNLNSQEELEFSVVIWFEGQDSNCVSTYAGTAASISLAFQIIE